MGCEPALRLLARYVLAVAVADGAAFCYLAGKLRALEAQLDSLIERASRYLAEFVISGDTALLFIRAGALCHARAFLASDSAYAYFHLEAPIFILPFCGLSRRDRHPQLSGPCSDSYLELGS